MAKKKKDDAEATTDEAQADSGGGKGNKIVTAAAVGAFVLTGYNVFLKPAPTATAEPVVVEVVEPMDGAIHELEEMVINLSDDGNGGATFLRVGIAIVLAEEEDPALFAADEAIAKDVIIELLGAKRADDLTAGPARQSVKQQLTDAMVEAYGEERVIRVLFTGLVMQ